MNFSSKMQENVTRNKFLTFCEQLKLSICLEWNTVPSNFPVNGLDIIEIYKSGSDEENYIKLLWIFQTAIVSITVLRLPTSHTPKFLKKVSWHPGKFKILFCFAILYSLQRVILQLNMLKLQNSLEFSEPFYILF